MATSDRRAGGLAARIVRITLVIGVITVWMTGTVAAIGAYRLASNQVQTADLGALRVIEDAISARLTAVEGVAARSAGAAASAPKPAEIGGRIAPVYDAADPGIDQVLVADADGHVLAAQPSSAMTLTVADDTVFQQALRGTTGFSRDAATPGGWKMWLTRTVVLSSDRPAVVLVHFDLSALQNDIARSASSGGRTIAVLDGGQAIAQAGQVLSSAALAQARWRSSGNGAGTAVVPAQDESMLSGHYADIQGIEGVGWRLLILEPANMVVKDTASAVAPSIGILVLGGAVAVLAAWALSSRLVRPLRTMQAAAYRAANGSYVKPIPAGGDDEIGDMASAFNAVALRLNALHDLSQLLASASQLDQVLDGILAAIGHIVGPGVAAVYLLDESGRWLVPLRARGADITRAAAVDALGDSWLARSLRDTDSIAYSGDSRQLGDELPGLAEDEWVALVAPLMSGHEVLGAIVVLRDAGTPITEAEREMVRTFSAQAAVAVHNSHLFSVETESRRVAEGLRSVAEKLVRPEDLGSSLRDVEGVVAELFGAACACLAVVDRPALGLPPSARRVEDGELLGFGLRTLTRSGGAKPVVVRAGDDPGADTMMQRHGASELLVVPIALDTDHGAVLAIAYASATAGQRDIELAQSVADEISLALDNAFLFERAVARAANLETIFRISQAVGSSLQVNVVLNRILDVVQKILSADAVALMTYDPRTRKIRTAMARGAVSPAVVDLELSPGEDVPGYVFSSGEPTAIRDLHDAMGGVAGDAAAHEMRSMLAVPLLARGRSIAVLMVYSTEAGAFSDEDMNVLQTFAAQAALALDTARLYSREHDVASILQASILPEALPDFPELAMASSYRPAGDEAEIGGDYYDAFRAPDGALWLAIADVCGKGVVAATKTSMIKYSVRSLVAAGLAPGAVMAEINRMVADTGEASDIVTLWVGRYDPDESLLMWSSGGHPPGLIRHADGASERLAATGPLLGAIPDVVFHQEEAAVHVGDVVLLYTDGVTEARSGNEFFGEERVRGALEAGGTPDDVVQRLLADVRRFAHGELRDDVAILAVEIREKRTGQTDEEGADRR